MYFEFSTQNILKCMVQNGIWIRDPFPNPISNFHNGTKEKLLRKLHANYQKVILSYLRNNFRDQNDKMFPKSTKNGFHFHEHIGAWEKCNLLFMH